MTTNTECADGNEDVYLLLRVEAEESLARGSAEQCYRLQMLAEDVQELFLEHAAMKARIDPLESALIHTSARLGCSKCIGDAWCGECRKAHEHACTALSRADGSS